MFGLFKSPMVSDTQLGDLHRKGGLWRGTLAVGDARVPLALPGSRASPDPQALDIARTIPTGYRHWQPSIAEELFEHYAPYAEAIAAGEAEPPVAGLPPIGQPSEVWPHVVVEFAQVVQVDGALCVEIGYRVAWDEEHTLGALVRGGELIGLNGSVLAP